MNKPIRLPPSFFNRPVLTVAQELIGCSLVYHANGITTRLIITEIEAYDGPDDLACHGRFGKTERTAAMFGPAGHWYVYLVYGMYWMLNSVVPAILMVLASSPRRLDLIKRSIRRVLIQLLVYGLKQVHSRLY